MQAVQQGDRVQVHYMIHFQDGSVKSSRGHAPLDLTVGIDHQRLPGLGLALVGLLPGSRTAIHVPPEQAYGLVDPSRVRRWSRSRFASNAVLAKGTWARSRDARGRLRLVRILEVRNKVVVVDTNHRWAGQSLEMEVEVLSIEGPAVGEPISRPDDDKGVSEDVALLKPGKAIAFDVDAASLASLQEALPGWQINDIYGATAASLPCDWNPGAVDFVVVGVRDNVIETLGLCRFLAFANSFSNDFRRDTGQPMPMGKSPQDKARVGSVPLLVLVPAGQKTVVGAALEAGAHSCLMLPIDPGDVVNVLVRSRKGNQPGRHTHNLDRPQNEDRWRDTGGQG